MYTQYRSQLGLFQTASYFRRKGGSATTDLRRLCSHCCWTVDRKDDRVDQTDGPEQRKWPPSRGHGSSLMSCAAVAIGDERSHAGSSGLRPQSGHRGEALHAATAPSQLTYRPPTGCPCKRCGLRCSTHCQLLEGKAKAVITTGALKTYYHTTCTSTRYPSHVHHVRLFTTRLCVQTIVDTVQSGFSFTRACCCSTMS